MVEIRRLEPSDRRDAFSCGVSTLDEFLRRYAGQNMWVRHTGVTYVAIDDESRRVLGFMTVSGSHGSRDELPGLPSSMPAYPLPLLRVARLAVDTRVSGTGIGSALVLFACELAVAQTERVGCVGIIVDAKSDAVGFYERFGFTAMSALAGASSVRPRQTPMFLELPKVRAALGEELDQRPPY